MIRRVRDLFDGHQDLINGFNTFIPQGYRLDTSASTPRSVNTSLSSPGQVYHSEISPGTLPSFSAFRNSDTPSSSSTAVSIHSTPQVNETTFYTSAVAQPPVLRSQLTTDSQTQQLPSHNYQHLPTPNSQPIIEGHLVYPSGNPSTHQQQPYVPNVQQQQHNAQSFNHAIIYVNKVKVRGDEHFIIFVEPFSGESRDL